MGCGGASRPRGAQLADLPGERRAFAGRRGFAPGVAGTTAPGLRLEVGERPVGGERVTCADVSHARRRPARGPPCGRDEKTSVASPGRPVRSGEMFERFTDRARRVVVLAQEEARMLNHNYIGTEHVLLGLIHAGEGAAAKALESLAIS